MKRHMKRPEDCNFIKKETVAQVFSCEFCEISKNAFCYKIPPVVASENVIVLLKYYLFRFFKGSCLLKSEL